MSPGNPSVDTNGNATKHTFIKGQRRFATIIPITWHTDILYNTPAPGGMVSETLQLKHNDKATSTPPSHHNASLTRAQGTQ